ncbi:MAG: ChbG/HpnK family deacetylase, partial [Bacteroidales bacterium]
MSKWLIVHADGFGLDDISTRTILALAKNDLISSTSIAANSVSSDQLETLAGIMPSGTGIHLNLVAGKALSKPSHLRGLVDESGRFLGSRDMIKNFFGGRLKPVTIWEEVSAQINRLARAGINISHADS